MFGATASLVFPPLCKCYHHHHNNFRSQVVQRFAKQKNLKASQVDLSRVKIKMLPREKNIEVFKEHLPGAGGEHTPGVAAAEGMSRDQREHLTSWKGAQRKRKKKKKLIRYEYQWRVQEDFVGGSQQPEAIPASRVKKQRVSDDFVYDSWNSDDDFEEMYDDDSPKKKRKRKREDKGYIPNFKYNRYDTGEVNAGLASGNTNSDSFSRLAFTRPYQRTASLPTQGKKHSIKNRLQDRIRNKNIHRYQTVRTLGAKSSVSLELGLPKGKRNTDPVIKRPRGRPRKYKVEPLIKIKRPRGRPSKQWKLKEAELLRAAALAESMNAQDKITANIEHVDGVTMMQHTQIPYSTITKQAQQSALVESTKDSVQPQYAMSAAESYDHMEAATFQNLSKRKKIMRDDDDDDDATEIQEISETHTQRSSSSKPIVLLKDLKFILPREAFGGKAVSALKIEDNIGLSHPEQFDPIASQGEDYSPLQSVFNSLTFYQPVQAGLEKEPGTGQPSNPKVM